MEGWTYCENDLTCRLYTSSHHRVTLLVKSNRRYLPTSNITATDITIWDDSRDVEVARNELRNLRDVRGPDYASVEVVPQELLDDTGILNDGFSESKTTIVDDKGLESSVVRCE